MFEFVPFVYLNKYLLLRFKMNSAPVLLDTALPLPVDSTTLRIVVPPVGVIKLELVMPLVHTAPEGFELLRLWFKGVTDAPPEKLVTSSRTVNVPSAEASNVHVICSSFVLGVISPNVLTLPFAKVKFMPDR